jgi:hypothetical protein
VRCCISCADLKSELLKADDVDRSDWVYRVQKSYPEIKELKERIRPLHRAISLAKLYRPNTRKRDKIDKKIVIQVLYFLHFFS